MVSNFGHYVAGDGANRYMQSNLIGDTFNDGNGLISKLLYVTACHAERTIELQRNYYHTR